VVITTIGMATLITGVIITTAGTVVIMVGTIITMAVIAGTDEAADMGIVTRDFESD
jgi:O-antigen/teichoic acid export membrane protein